jgi:hypothetical protein
MMMSTMKPMSLAEKTEKGGENEVERPEKCNWCYKYRWCMLSHAQSFECLGPFSGVEENIRRLITPRKERIKHESKF